ncbi:MAG: HAD-IB family hydrolase [Vicinamibacterales bacterium]
MVVLFDVDRTLVGVNCTAALARALASDGVVPWRTVAALAVEQWLYRLRLLPFATLMAHAYALIEERDIARVEATAERVVRHVVMPALLPEAVARIARHRSRGDRVVLASAAPAVVIERVARHVGVDEVIATEYERTGPRFGAVRTPQAYGAGKVALARQAGLLDGEPPHVYTDHAEDWPLIQASGFATLVNPARHLVREVRRQHLAHEVVRWERGGVTATATSEPASPGP